MIRIDDLTVELPNPATATYSRILTGISVRIDQGVISGITGPSGSGKSTLVSTLGGLLPDSARVSAASFELTSSLRFDRVESMSGRAWRQRLQSASPSRTFCISQDARSTLFPNRTVAWHLKRADAVARRQGGPTGRWTPTEALADVGFERPEQYLTRLPGQLSTGQCQRIQFAMAGRLPLQHLLADEPFASVDSKTKRQLASQLRHMAAQGLSVLLVTHDLELLHNAANSALVIHRGTLAAEGPVDRILPRVDRSSLPAMGHPVESSMHTCGGTDWNAPLSAIQNVVSACGLTKKFVQKPLWGDVKETTAFRNRSITIPAGSRTALLGESGAGKTTFARIVMALTTATSGSLCRHPHAGHDESWNDGLTPQKQRELWKDFQLVCQDTDLVFDPSARIGDALVQVSRVAFPDRSTRDLWTNAGHWLHRFGLADDVLLAPAVRLSGGEKRRAAIIRSLLSMGVELPEFRRPQTIDPTTEDHNSAGSKGNSQSEPVNQSQEETVEPTAMSACRLLILDEPTVGLDQFWQDMLAEELVSVQQDSGLTCLVISHDRRFVGRFCDHIVEWHP